MFKRLIIFCICLIVILFAGLTVANAQNFWDFNPLELELGIDIFTFEKDHAFILLSEEVRPNSIVASYYFAELFGDSIFMIVITNDSLVTGIALTFNDISQFYVNDLFDYLEDVLMFTDNNWMFWSFYEETETTYKIIWSRAYYDYVLSISINSEGYYDFMTAKLKRFIIKVPYENRRIEEDES